MRNRIYAEDMIVRPYNPAHFGNPQSRGARGECARCGGKGPIMEIKNGAVWLPLCHGCGLLFTMNRPVRGTRGETQ